ncbi:MAG: MraY family glycosyltransferase [Pseudomonadota bacterium]
MLFVFAFLAAMIVSMALLPLLIRFGRRFDFVDAPAPRKVHSVPIPRIGGLAIGLGVVSAVVVADAAVFSPAMLAIMLGGAIVLIAGLVDDKVELGYRSKFAAQILAAIIVVYIGDVSIREVSLPQTVVFPDWLAKPLSVFIIVALTNAVALSDGLDGLAGGIVFICCTALALLAWATGNVPSALLAVALAGAIFGFLRFNTHPAIVFMGDSGSQFLGLLSAVLAIEVTQDASAHISAALPLLLLAVPIIDTAQVTISRLRRGVSPFSADKYHLHHRLLSIGFAHPHAVLIIYIAQSSFFLLAYFLRYQSDLLIAVAFVATASALLLPLLVAQRRAEQSPATPVPDSGATLVRIDDRARRNIVAWVARGVVGILALYVLLLIVGIAKGGSMTPTADATASQVQQLALILLAALVASFVLLSKPAADLFAQGTGYVVAAMIAFSASGLVWSEPLFASLEFTLLIVLGLGNVAWLIFNSNRALQLTTLDILLLFAALVVPNLPVLSADVQGLATLVFRLVVLFYSVEVIAAAFPRGLVLRMAVTSSLLLIAVNTSMMAT